MFYGKTRAVRDLKWPEKRRNFMWAKLWHEDSAQGKGVGKTLLICLEKLGNPLKSQKEQEKFPKWLSRRGELDQGCPEPQRTADEQKGLPGKHKRKSFLLMGTTETQGPVLAQQHLQQVKPGRRETWELEKLLSQWTKVSVDDLENRTSHMCVKHSGCNDKF